MNTNHPTHERAAERHLDLMLAERLAREAAPDVSARTIAALNDKHRHDRRAWLQAACALVGLGIVVAIATQVPDDRRQAMQQPAIGPPVTVRTIAEVEALPPHTDNVRLELYTADAVRALVRLRGLRRLDASYEVPDASPWHDAVRPAFFPEAADSIGLLPSIEELDISGHGPITGLERLATLSRLRRLRIYHALVEPRGLAVLKQLPKLEHLVLDCTLSLDRDAPWIDMRHPDYGIASVAANGRLRSLTLGACIADAAAIRAIAKNPLDHLHLEYLQKKQKSAGQDTLLDAAAYVSVGSILTLRELVFRDSVNPELIAGLRKMPHLTRLDLGSADGLEGTAIGAAIAALPHLTTLKVDGSFIDHAALLALTECKTLVDFELGADRACTDDVLAKACQMPRLRRLQTPMDPGFTDAGMAALAKTSLESLRLTWADNISPDGLLHLPKTLREVAVDGHMLRADVFAHLATVPSWTVNFHSRLQIPLIRGLLESPLAEHLEQLTLVGDLGLLDSLAPLADLPKLRKLDLEGCSGEFPPEDLRHLRDHVQRIAPPRRRPVEAGAQVMEEAVDVVGPARPGREKHDR